MKAQSLTIKGRKGFVIELGKLGIWLGFWFIAIDYIGGFHYEAG